MGRLIALLITLTVIAPPAFGQGAQRMKSTTGATTTIGTRNVPLRDGALALKAGRSETGIQLTLQGLEIAQGRREEEAALSNLCAGYIQLEKYNEAKKYCDMLLQRNENSWRGYNNRAVIFIQTKNYDKADSDLTRGEELNPGAHTLKVARAMYRDAVDPVRPEVEIDDRKKTNNEQSDAA